MLTDYNYSENVQGSLRITFINFKRKEKGKLALLGLMLVFSVLGIEEPGGCWVSALLPGDSPKPRSQLIMIYRRKQNQHSMLDGLEHRVKKKDRMDYIRL